MLVIVRVFPPVLTPWTDAAAGTVDAPASLATLLVNFFTVNDFSALLSRRAMLPLIVFSLLFGFSVSTCGGPDTVTARVLDDATKCLLKMVSLVSCYAPIAFFGFFAAMVASYGAQITASYARAMLAYYPLCFVYALLVFPLLAYLGGGREGVRRLRRHILRPAVTALGTCSSVATIPANMEAAEDSGITRSRILCCRWARRCTWTARASAACSRSRFSSACSACRLRARDCLPRCWPWRSFPPSP